MKRSLAVDCLELIGQEVRIAGWVQTVRKHGKIAFFDLRERSGILQIGAFDPSIVEAVSKLNPQDVVEVKGIVKKREERFVNKEMMLGTIEVEASFVSLLVASAAMPFDMGGKDLVLEIPTLLDNRALTLRHPKVSAIFKLQNVVIDAFRRFMQSQDFTEFQPPLIIPAIPEGGAEVFEVKYFENKAFLAQSPQLYKQILVGVFERVFSVNKIFRAEPSVTTRHLTEVISLDAEMGFINDWIDVRKMAESTIKFILRAVEEKCKDELEMLGATIPKVSDELPSLKLREAQQIIYDRTKRDNRNEKDLSPEDEREICKWATEEKDSELVFISHYPTKTRPFYTYPDPENPEYNQGFDLLGRGTEWMTGGRRINDYDILYKHAVEWGINPDKIKLYLDAFRYGIPPEGGFAFGAERITMHILGLQNIREASLFPRDMERIDERFSKTSDTDDEAA